MKNLNSIFILLLLLSACKKNNPITDLSPGTIENQTFKQTVVIDGHDYDGTTIKNCVFENIKGDGIQIRDVNNLTIENCTFKNITENAIRFRNSGSSDGVQILNNIISEIEYNGILAAENHINTLIKGNLIFNVGQNNSSSLAGHPHHGIYFQGFNVNITENTIHDIENADGNCISIRTYGSISKNILYHASDHGISYYSDHPGDNQPLLIENNFIYDNGKRGINIASNGTSSNHISEAIVRFNTLISTDKAPLNINNGMAGVGLNFIGNILIRTDGATEYIYCDLPYTDSYNYTATSDIGFVNFETRDLHLDLGSAAIGFATGTMNYPSEDIDHEIRDPSALDAGADQRY